MSLRRKKEKFQEVTDFERGRFIGLQEGRFFYLSIVAHMKRNSSTVIIVWKQWTDKNLTTRKTSNRRRKVTLAHDERHLLHMAVNDRTASSRQLTAQLFNATGILMPALSIR